MGSFFLLVLFLFLLPPILLLDWDLTSASSRCARSARRLSIASSSVSCLCALRCRSASASSLCSPFSQPRRWRPRGRGTRRRRRRSRRWSRVRVLGSGRHTSRSWKLGCNSSRRPPLCTSFVAASGLDGGRGTTRLLQDAEGDCTKSYCVNECEHPHAVLAFVSSVHAIHLFFFLVTARPVLFFSYHLLCSVAILSRRPLSFCLRCFPFDVTRCNSFCCVSILCCDRCEFTLITVTLTVDH